MVFWMVGFCISIITVVINYVVITLRHVA